MARAECDAHPEVPLVARCHSCDRGLCAECWASTVDGEPTCAPCVAILTRPLSILVPLVAAAVAGLVALRVGWVLRAGGAVAWASAGAGFVLAAVAAWRLTAKANARRAARRVVARPPDPPRPPPRGGPDRGHPYRGALVRSARRLAPPVSGPMAALVVGAALILTATGVPAALTLPRWIELELVLGAWWLIWTTALAGLLYRGFRVGGDRA